MLIDLITLGILIIAVFKGFTKGLVMALFSLIGLFIGLAAAIKLSAITAVWLGESVNLSAKWLPLLAFLLVFILVVVLVNSLGKLLDAALDWAFLGWLNAAGGILFFSLVYLLIWSVVLFYLGKMELLSAATMEHSVSYPVIAPMGPVTIDTLGQLIPAFKHMFEDISQFFQKLSAGMETTN